MKFDDKPFELCHAVGLIFMNLMRPIWQTTGSVELMEINWVREEYIWRQLAIHRET